MQEIKKLKELMHDNSILPKFAKKPIKITKNFHVKFSINPRSCKIQIF
jgi:hypothetical protein